MRRLLLTMLQMLVSAVASADAIDSLYDALKLRPQIQERIYVQTDNNCYFVGDTLWYKAFTLRADSLIPTDMSRLLYVELLTPDGYLVARNRHFIGADGTSNGQFFIDSDAYSGFYEVRAYTKWQLNFNEKVHPHGGVNRNVFYNKEFEEAYFREQEGLYSRVIPIYESPQNAGDFADKRIIPRPKQRVYQDKPELMVKFYPEGGQLVSGIDSRVAFEVTDNEGQGVSLTGYFDNGVVIQSNSEGRGTFNYSAAKKYGKVKFSYNGKDESFALPEVQQVGSVVTYDSKANVIKVKSQGVAMGALSISCRGVLYHFDRNVRSDYSLDLKNVTLPTGINEVVVYDNEANPLASRLFFVNNNDRTRELSYDIMSADKRLTDTLKASPYAPIELSVKGREGMPQTFCVAVRDNNVAELSYDDGNIMTDLLLSGELKGFIANPAQYFPEDQKLKAKAKEKLDLLMMVQGWRRYKRVKQLRYLPERNFTYEGQVLNVPSNSYILDKAYVWSPGEGVSSAIGNISCKVSVPEGREGMSMRAAGGYDCQCKNETHMNPTADDPIYYKKLKNKQIVMEAELIKDKDVAAVTAEINDNGYFKINLPPFYDNAVMMLTAYQNKDSLKKAMTSHKDKRRMDETYYPDYYVKQNMFFPMFTQPYSWYQHNAPDNFDYVEEEDVPAALQNNRLAGDHYLQNVTVRKRRKSKRAINWDKSAVVMDAYQLYNEMTDYGLSHGVLNMTKFTNSAATYLFGYFDEPNEVKIRGMIELDNELVDSGQPKKRTTFFRNYVPSKSMETDIGVSQTKLLDMLRMNRMKNIRVYTDYDKRNGVRMVSDGIAAVTLVIEPFPDEGKQYTYRDRRYILDGITYPEEFYSPDYSQQKPSAPTDYRRTLYWNPNAKPDDDGIFRASFYNNSRPTTFTVVASGIDNSGNFYYCK